MQVNKLADKVAELKKSTILSSFFKNLPTNSDGGAAAFS